MNPRTASPQAAPTAKVGVIEVDERSFQQAVIERSHEVPVVIDFWAPWCGPCRTLGPVLERLAAEANGAWILAKVNVDENPRLSQSFRVQGIPAVIAISGGKMVDQFTGALPESQVRAWLKRIVPTREGSMLDTARALESSDPVGAVDRYRLILGEQPDNDEALFALGRIQLLRGEREGSEALRQLPASSPLFARAHAALPLVDLLEAADSHPANELEARYQQAAAAVRAGDYTKASDELLAIIARDRNFRDDAARHGLLALLAALGDEHPLVPGARRRLANTLF